MKSKMRILRKGMAMLVISALLLGMVQAVSGSTTYPLPSASPESLAAMKSNVRNGFFDYEITEDTEAGHPQGICVDDAYQYLYISRGTVIDKVELASGETVGKLGGLTGKYHFGDVSYYNGRVYCSTYWEDVDYKSFVAAIDENAWPLDRSKKTVDLEKDGDAVHGFLLKDIVGFKAWQNGSNKFRCYAVDGICFGKYPGDKSGDTYMFTSYGGAKINESGHAYDDDYRVIGAYKVDNFIGNANVDIPLTTDRISSNAYTEAELLASDKLLFLQVGGVQYGNAQTMSYDKDTGDIVLVTYDSTKGWNTNLNGVKQTTTRMKYVIDGSKAPINKTLELGQNNNDSNASLRSAAIARAELYKENGVMPTGDHAVLKCICGKGDIDAHEAVPAAYSSAHVDRYSDAVGVDAGFDVKLCFRYTDAREDYGQVSLGDGYYYATYDYQSVKKVRLYRRDENYKLTVVEEIPKEPGENLLVNGDFEESETNSTLGDTFATGWDVDLKGAPTDAGLFEYLPTSGSDGGACIKVWDRNKSKDAETGATINPYYNFAQQTGIPFEAGKVYTLSFDFKTTVQAGSSPCIRINFGGTSSYNVDFGYRKATVTIGSDKFPSSVSQENDFLGTELSANDWHKISITFVCPPGEWNAEKSYLQLKHLYSCEGVSYYDNVSLVEEKASLGYYNADGDAITGIANNGTGKATFRSVGDGTAEGKTVTLLSAYYSKEGNQLLGIYPAVTGAVGTRTTFVDVTNTAGKEYDNPFWIVENMELDMGFTAPEEGDFLIKTFVWDGVSTLKPIVPGVSLPKAAE